MNIYELEKRATPGPLYVADDDAWVLTSQHPDGGDIAHSYGNKEDVILLAHCRNHFLEALEALKEEHEACVCEDEIHGGVHQPSVCPTCKVIAKLETVEEW